MTLDDLRRQLDELDSALLDLLRRRAAVVEEVGHSKRATGTPVYAPEREREILDRVAAADLGEFPMASAQVIFKEILAACRSLQEPPRIAYLGPAGTFTEMAARSLFGAGSSFLPQPDIAAVFDTVSGGHVEAGLVPIENSTAGTIREVLDLLATAPLTIVGETYVDIHHCLLSHAELQAVEVVYSKDTALAQCRAWLQEHLPHARQEAVASTALGAELAAAQPAAAAIAPEQAAEVYELPVRAQEIEDRSDNRTRFFALGKTPPLPSGRDKTSLVISVAHRPGALVKALSVLRDHALNMTLIESRPSPFAAFEYLFYIDVEGHRQDPAIAAALGDLSTVCLLTQVLGSYPRAV